MKDENKADCTASAACEGADDLSGKKASSGTAPGQAAAQKQFLEESTSSTRFSADETAKERKKTFLRRGFPSMVDMLVFFGIFLLANLIGGVVALAAGFPWPSTIAAGDEAAQIAASHFNAVAYFVSMSLTLAGLLFYRARRGGPRIVARFSRRGLNPALLVWGILFMVATTVVLEPLLGLLPPVPEVYGRGAWTVATLVVMAPLFEEVLFRGVILESTRMRYGVIAAWLLSSVVFALVHVHPTVAVNAFFMGLIFGFIYIASDSLWASIILHAVNNGIAYVVLNAGYGMATIAQIVDNRTVYLLIYAAAAAVFFGSGYMTLRTLRRLKEREKISHEA